MFRIHRAGDLGIGIEIEQRYHAPQKGTKLHKSRLIIMASRAAKIAAVAREIFGTLPNRNVRTGLQFLKKPLTGAYEARYYMEPIEPYARKVRATLYVCDNVLFRTMHQYACVGCVHV